MYELMGENFLKWDSSKQKWHDFWNGLWVNNQTKWDQNGIHPELVPVIKRLMDLGLIKDVSLHYEPGCGRAYIGAYLARLGYKAVSEDINDIAIDHAKELHKDLESLEINKLDFLC